MTFSIRKKLVRSAAGLAAFSAVAGGGALVSHSPASADPQQYTAPIFGYGSDTVQDVTNAFAGFSNGVDYTPLRTPTGNRQLVSWDAFPAGSCIAPKVGGPTILRPNGSGDGQKILKAAFAAGNKWPLTTTAACGGQQNVQGMVDFGRSSSGPGALANPSGPLVWVPFARDALSFAYIRPAGNPVTSITTADLKSLHQNGVKLLGPSNDIPVIACGIQTSSGTYKTFMGDLALASDGTGDPGTALCNSALNVSHTDGRVEENSGPELNLKAARLHNMTDPLCDGVAGGTAVACDNAQLIVGFSASQFIARSNGVGTPAPGLGANGGLGAINGQAAATFNGTKWVPVQAAYDDTTFGRDVYYVLPFQSIDTANFTDIPYITEMFVGSTSKVCSAGTTIQDHGFRTIANCGATTSRGNFP